MAKLQKSNRADNSGGATVMERPVESDSDAQTGSAASETASEATAAAAKDASRSVMVEIPVRQRPGGYAKRDLKSLDGRHAKILKSVADGLREDETMLEKGRSVQDSDDAIMWLLEQVSKSMSRRD
jgi:hypothetical protein